MLENIKRIRAIDYTDIGKIPNYVEEVVKKTLEILEIPNIFGKKEEDVSFAVEKAMDIIAIENFSDEELEKYGKDENEEAEKISTILRKNPSYFEA